MLILSHSSKFVNSPTKKLPLPSLSPFDFSKLLTLTVEGNGTVTAVTRLYVYFDIINKHWRPPLHSRGFVTLLSYNHTDGSTRKAEGVTKAVFKISAVGEVEKLLRVAEYNEGGRCDRGLRHIVNLKALALIGRGLHTIILLIKF